MEKLHILMVEGSEADAEIIVRELRKASITFTVRRVETRDEYIAEINGNRPDLLLVDYALPGFDGLSALRIAMEKCPRIPFIFVSGVIEEENVIESLKAGATDYVFKHRLSRLVSVVKRALQEVKEREEMERAEQALRDSELRYRELVENINDVIFFQDNEGTITYISPALERMSQYKVEDIVGKSFVELVYPEDLPRLMESYTRTMEGNLEPWEFRLFDKDGSILWVRTSSTPLARDGETTGLLGIVTDITERKQTEEHIKFLSSVVEQSTEGMAIADLEGALLFVNQCWSAMHGYESPDELVGKHLSIFHSSEQLEKEVKPFNEKVMEQGYYSGEVGHTRRDGSTFPALMTTTLLKDDRGNQIAIAGIAKDITERKKNEDRISHLNLVIRSIRNVNQLITKEKDRDRLLEGVCENLIENRGYNKCWIALLDSDNRFLTYKEAGWGDALSPLIDALSHDNPPQCCKRVLNKQDIVVITDPPGKCSDCPLSESYDEGIAVITSRLEYSGTLYGLMGVTIPGELAEDSEEQSLFREVAEDIAFALYNIEKEKEREAFQRGLAERVKEISCLYLINEMGRRSDYSIDDFLRETVRIIPTGCQSPDLTGCRIVCEGKEYRTDNFREVGLKLEADIVINRERAGKIEVCLLEPPPAGEEPFLEEEQELIEAIAFTHAVIINQRQSMNTLRTSEEKYRTILEQMMEGYFENDFSGTVTFANKAMCEFFGYQGDEIIGMNYRQLMSEATARQVRQLYNGVYQSGEPQQSAEYDVIRKDGSERVIEASVALVKDQSSRPVGFRSLVHDITERKKAVEQIRLSLREKEVMLQEIHHRVKNNMQVISSLLGLQKKYIWDERDLELFRDSQNRIRSMALVHEKLYRSRDLARIDFAEYTKDLVHQLLQFYSAKNMNIDLQIAFEGIHLGVDIAIPCALIINELVSNSLKHAFPDGGTGIIKVDLTRSMQGEYTLTVLDTGVGFPEEIDFKNIESLGMQLVNAFTKQIKGTVSLIREKGTQFIITFHDKKEGKGVP